MLKIEERLDRFPPLVCRLLAREGESNRHIKPLTDDQIAERSGLSISRVKALSWLVDWKGVEVYEMLAFSKGCGVDLSDRSKLAKHLQYVRSKRNRTWQYLKKHHEWDSRWSQMITLYQEHLIRKYAKQ